MLQFSCSIDESCLSTPLPRFVLQPIIENSIQHGMREDIPLTIKLHIQRNKNHILITISDNGKGMTHSQLASLKEQLSEMPKDEHIGLTNVVRRMQLIYMHCFTYDVQSIINQGTTIILRLTLENICL